MPPVPEISIHAPARGATLWLLVHIVLLPISIHAPARGATEFRCWILSAGKFQSTLPRGERLFQTLLLMIPCDFNPRSREGRDSFFASSLLPVLNFNPRSREGSDFPLAFEYNILPEFQSTLPRGERPGSRGLTGKAGVISIHAPARGATFNPARFLSVDRISIHAPARGATSIRRKCQDNRRISIHAPARGATDFALTV